MVLDVKNVYGHLAMVGLGDSCDVTPERPCVACGADS